MSGKLKLHPAASLSSRPGDDARDLLPLIKTVHLNMPIEGRETGGGEGRSLFPHLTSL